MPETIRAYVAGTFRPRRPLGLWATFVAWAVVGSSLFGASLAFAFPNLNPGAAAFFFTAGAGAAWILFLPLLRVATRQSWDVCIHISLEAMAAGEAILMTGALANAIGWSVGGTPHALIV